MAAVLCMKVVPRFQVLIGQTLAESDVHGTRATLDSGVEVIKAKGGEDNVGVGANATRANERRGDALSQIVLHPFHAYFPPTGVGLDTIRVLNTSGLSSGPFTYGGHQTLTQRPRPGTSTMRLG